MLKNQTLAVETFQSKWQMVGQEAHAFIARTRSQSEDFARAELTTVQRFEDSLQRSYDGHLRSHVHVLQGECRSRPRLRNPTCIDDQLQQTLRHQLWEEEHADAESTREMDQLRRLISEQSDAMLRVEAHSQHRISQQQEEHARKQQTQFQQFDSARKDKDLMVQRLTQELANQKEHFLEELEQALQDSERRSQVVHPVCADGLSTQPCATPVEKKTFQAAVAHAVPVQASQAFALGASAGDLNLRARTKGSSSMIIPRRRLRTKTPRAALERISSVGLVRRRMRSKGPPSQPKPHASVPQGSGGGCFFQSPEGGGLPAGGGPGSGDGQNKLSPGLLRQVQEVHQDEMEEVVMVQKEVMGKHLKALTRISNHRAVPSLTVTQTPVEMEVGRITRSRPAYFPEYQEMGEAPSQTRPPLQSSSPEGDAMIKQIWEHCVYLE